MKGWKRWCAALAVAGACVGAQPATAAHETPPLTVERALVAADREWPGHACEGRVDVLYASFTDKDGKVYADGQASGLEPYHTGAEWKWSRARCEITIRNGLEPHRRCRVIVHEVGHLARGDASHDEGQHGVMSTGGGYESAEDCRTVEVAHRLLLADAKSILSERLRPAGPWRVTCKRIDRLEAECAARGDAGERRRYRLREEDDKADNGRVYATRVSWRAE